MAYIIEDNIIDLCFDSSPQNFKVENSYNKFSLEYDTQIMQGFRGMWGGLSFEELLLRLVEEIKCFPDGVILDVPGGTARFSAEFYKTKPNSFFIALDYSMGMLRVAQKRCTEAGIKNVIFIRGDVTNLPLKDNTLDGCLSINGFHAFMNPEERRKKYGEQLRRVHL